MHDQHDKMKEAEVKYSDKKQRIFDFLEQHPVGVLSAVTKEGEPHGTVIYFAFDEDLGLMFLTRNETKKYSDLKHHNTVMLTAFDAEHQTVVQINGVALQLPEDTVDQVAGSIIEKAMKTSETGVPPIFKLEEGDYVAFRIIPTRMSMAVYARPNGGGYPEVFEVLETEELWD